MNKVRQSQEWRERSRAWKRVAAATFLITMAGAPRATESAIANGDTRTLTLVDNHTNESGSFTYMVNGSYDMAVLEKLNWFLRDWRLNESIKMDPKLFDILWEVYRESGSKQPVDVLSGYRSPQTNAMLRRRSRQVAEHSQHMEGRAIDAHFLDVGPAPIRDIAMRMQAGGVGFYPVGITPWVHIDSGAVRYWPRMSRDALARLFPDGKTVFIPADGQPMAGYDLARAEIEARGGNVVPAGSAGGNLFAWLFGGPRGGGSDDAEESGDGAAYITAVGGRGRGGAPSIGVTEFALNSHKDEPVAATPSPTQTAALADVDAEAPATPQSEVTLRGPIAAEFIAPLPPRKPQALVDLASADAPLPPARPAELYARPAVEPVSFSVASTSSKRVDLEPPRPPEFVGPTNSVASPHDERDMILALLKRGQVPDVITKGIKPMPHDALALAETGAPQPPERPDLIRQAAALAAPLPPRRPQALGPTRDARLARAQEPGPGKAAAANPFGAIAPYAFDPTSDAPAVAERLLKAKTASAQNDAE